MSINTSNYNDIFGKFETSISQIEKDIWFWKIYLLNSIKKYVNENPVNETHFESGFSFDNINADGKTRLNIKDKSISIETADLTNQANNFFSWITNSSIARAYNSIELLLLQSIQMKYASEIENTIDEKKRINSIQNFINSFLKENGFRIDTKNNSNIISFIRIKSIDFDSFLKLNMNDNFKNTWEDFFNLISILRHVVVHDGMNVSQNVKNNLNSIAGDIFKHYFYKLENNAPTTLKFNLDTFPEFINYIKSFAGNAIKFIAQEDDLKFIGYHPLVIINDFA